MPPAIIAGGIAAAGTIGGALIGSHQQSQAVQQANNSQQAATQAQLQLGQQALGLNQSIYNSNYDLLSPFVSRGNVAGDAINALLGLPSAPHLSSPLASNPAVQTGGGTGGTPLGSIPGVNAPATSIQQILPYANDGVPGNYAAGLQQYYGAHPPDLASIAGMKNDGIPGNYAAAQQYAGSHPSGVQTAPVVSQTPVNSLAPQTDIHQQAQAAIAAGANPAMVQQRLQQMGGRV